MFVAPEEKPGSSLASRTARLSVLLVLAVGCAASGLLYARWISRPYLAVDDFQILLHSWTWERTGADLWVPANEHAMPLGRVSTWVLVQLAGRASALPQVAALQGPLALLLGQLLLYLFVRRELGQPFYGLAAAILFGVSTVYEQAIYWFSASFSVLTLDTLLLALLAAQAWRQTRRPAYLALAVLGAALAPGWFASGVLAGPLTALYLLPLEAHPQVPRFRDRTRSLLVALVPLLGTALFLAVSLPRTAQAIMHLPHYGEKTALQSFQLLPGLKYTVWSVVENLLLGNLGLSSVDVPFGLAVALWPMLVVVAGWCWRGSPEGRRLMLLGWGLILAGYLLVYSARADWTYEGHMNRPNWSRYHLLPQLGLALFIVAALPSWAGRWSLRSGTGLGPAPALALVGLACVLTLIQLPRTFWTDWTPADDEQGQVLRQVDEVDRLCREYRISAATAREALEWLDIPGGGTQPENRLNAWDFLWGSPNPDPALTPEQARSLLQPRP